MMSMEQSTSWKLASPITPKMTVSLHFLVILTPDCERTCQISQRKETLTYILTLTTILKQFSKFMNLGFAHNLVGTKVSVRRDQ